MKMDMSSTSSSRQGCFNVCFTELNCLLTNYYGLLRFLRTHVCLCVCGSKGLTKKEKISLKSNCITLIYNYEAVLFCT